MGCEPVSAALPIPTSLPISLPTSISIPGLPPISLPLGGSPSDPLEADAFLDLTLRLAQDPDAWPVLVHCHGCMDRSPAWMGIYRFLVEGRPLALAPALLLPLLALAARTHLGSEDTADVYGQGHSPGSVRNHRSALRAALGHAVGDPKALGLARGQLTLAAWQVKLDFHQLGHAPFQTLTSIYRTPVYSSAPSTPFLDELRGAARELLARRLADWDALDPENARLSRQALERVDPAFAAYRPVLS